METAIEVNEGDSKKYEVEAICDSKVYTKELNNSQLSGLYYLVSWKGFSEEKNTWKPDSAVLHLCKLINTFHRDNLERPIATSPPIDSAPPMARPTFKPRAEASSKQKRGRPAKHSSACKRAKKT